VSFDIPEYTAWGRLRWHAPALDAIARGKSRGRFYQRRRYELFGQGREVPTRIRRRRVNPRSQYGVGRASATGAPRKYREAYGTYAVKRDPLNHESPRPRGRDVRHSQGGRRGTAAILRGEQNELLLVNLEDKRDGASARTHDARARMLPRTQPRGFVIATGGTTDRRVLDEVVRIRGLGLSDYGKIGEPTSARRGRRDDRRLLEGRESSAGADGEIEE